MHVLAFMYPNAPGKVFDIDHWRNVHLPLGLGLTNKYLGIRPKKVVLLSPTAGGDLHGDSAPYGGIAMVMFESREAAEKLATLFEFKEAADRLSADFANYAAGPPSIMVSEVHEVTDIDAVIEAFVRNGG